MPLQEMIRKGMFANIYIYMTISHYKTIFNVHPHNFYKGNLSILPLQVIYPPLSHNLPSAIKPAVTSFCQVRHWHCRRRSMGETSDQSTPCLIHYLRIQSCCQSMVVTGFLLRLWFARNDLELFGYGDFCP